jgi:hypothetical protein
MRDKTKLLDHSQVLLLNAIKRRGITAETPMSDCLLVGALTELAEERYRRLVAEKAITLLRANTGVRVDNAVRVAAADMEAR